MSDDAKFQAKVLRGLALALADERSHLLKYGRWGTWMAFAGSVLVAAAMILAGCASVRDSLDQIRGVAPEDGSCSIVVYDSDTARMLSSQAVSGRFSIGFHLGNEYPRKVDIAGVCSGRTTKTFHGVVPGSVGMTEMGNIAP